MKRQPLSNHSGDRVLRQNETIYWLCGRCGMDMLAPSWCACRPKRIKAVNDLPKR